MAVEEPLTIRRSVSLLLLRLFGVLLLLNLIYLGARYLFDNFSSISALGSLILFVIFFVVDFTIFIVFFLRWRTMYYIISPKELVFVKGIFKKNRQVFPIRDIQKITVDLSMLGRFLRYGRLILYMPVLGYDLVMVEVPDPEKTIKIIEDFIPKMDEGGGGGKFLFSQGG